MVMLSETGSIELQATLSRFDTSTKQRFAGLLTPCPTLFALPLSLFFLPPPSLFLMTKTYRKTIGRRSPLNPSGIEKGSLLSSGP